VLARPARLGQVRLVCVDGPAGSGKTTFAGPLAARLDAAVIHMDDLYDGWTGLEDSWSRLSTQVLEPLRQGRPGRYQRYDWTADRFADWVDVPVRPVLVVEGCGSGRREGASLTTLLAWVEAPPDERLRRGLERDGEELRDRWTAWMATEDQHFTANDTRTRADVRILTHTAARDHPRRHALPGGRDVALVPWQVDLP
jgi:uridine kinase